MHRLRSAVKWMDDAYCTEPERMSGSSSSCSSATMVLLFCLITATFLLPFTQALSETDSFVRYYDNGISEGRDNCAFTECKQQADYYQYLSACRKEGSSTLYRSDGKSCGKDVQVARAAFRNAVNETGWGILEVETFANADEITQAFAAGVLEEGMCEGHAEFCKKLYNYLSENLDWIKRTIIQKSEVDTYWKQVNLTFAQLTGMNYGYLTKSAQSYKPVVRFELTPIYMIQLSGEFIDLEKVFGKNGSDTDAAGHCSGFVKLAPGNADLFFAHVAMSGYNTMNRILKIYNFAFDKQEVPGYAVSFSAYPASLASLDDFILASSGLAVIETTFAIFNESLYRNVRPTGQLHCWIRSIIATRLANTAKKWTKIFSLYNSGTYNNQWSVVDYKLFKPGKEIPTNGVLWVLEQAPGLMLASDLTWFLKNYTYWPSYNIPYFKTMNELSGFKQKGETLDWYKWGSSPRARIFDRDHHKVVDIDSLQRLMRYNDYKHDEFSRCKCVPPYTAEGGISTRGDLNPANGTYEVESMGHRNHGGIDYKGTNYKLFKRLRFRAWGGPTYNPLPVFSWATTDIEAKHYGQPTVWQFKEMETDWEVNVMSL